MSPLSPELLTAVREAIPGWALWAPVWSLPLTLAILGTVLTWPMMMWASRAARRHRDAHWTEAAGHMMRPRVAAALVLYLLPLQAAVVATSAAWIAPVPHDLVVLATVGLVAVPGALALHVFVNRHLTPPMRLRQSLLGILTQSVLVLGHLAAPVLLYLVWPLLSPIGVLRFALLALAFGVMAAGLPLRGLALLGLARPVTGELRSRIDALLGEVAIPVRHVYRAPLGQANAFAFPTTGDVLLTERLLHVLEVDEVLAVMAHEIGHLKAPKSVVYARLLPVAPIYVLPALRGLPPLHMAAGFFAAVLAYVILSRLLYRWFREDEEAADALAATHQGAAGVYAGALEKIYRANLMPVVMAEGQSVHPHLYDRMLEAGVQPSYPRPAPTSRRAGMGPAIVTILLFLFAGLIVRDELPGVLGTTAAEQALWHVALGDPRPYDLAKLGERAFLHAEWAEARALYAAADALDPGYAYYLANVAGAEAGMCHCEDARAHWAVAFELASAAGEDLELYTGVQDMVASCERDCP